VVGKVLPAAVPRVTSPLQGVAAWTARRFATPKGWGAEAEPVRPAVTVERPRTPWWVALLAPVIGILVAAVVWGLADSPTSLIIGVVAGVVLALVPGLFTLWLGVFRSPEPTRRQRLLFNLLPFVAVAVVSAAVAVVATG
jgi:multisubunit Na+/H+ antiporter MnhB subunit